MRATAAEKLNLLLITVDDMSADSIGAFGCKLPGTTPLAASDSAAGSVESALAGRAASAAVWTGVSSSETLAIAPPPTVITPSRPSTKGICNQWPAWVSGLLMRAAYRSATGGTARRAAPLWQHRAV